jgi:hypothetical protein
MLTLQKALFLYSAAFATRPLIAIQIMSDKKASLLELPGVVT